jgi:hypothetical protein
MVTVSCCASAPEAVKTASRECASTQSRRFRADSQLLVSTVERALENWKGTNRCRKNLSIRSGRRSFAVRGDGSCKGETRHSGIDMNARRMMYAVKPNPACDGTDHGDPAPAFSQPTGPGRLWISLGADCCSFRIRAKRIPCKLSCDKISC